MCIILTGGCKRMRSYKGECVDGLHLTDGCVDSCVGVFVIGWGVGGSVV